MKDNKSRQNVFLIRVIFGFKLNQFSRGEIRVANFIPPANGASLAQKAGIKTQTNINKIATHFLVSPPHKLEWISVTINAVAL